MKRKERNHKFDRDMRGLFFFISEFSTTIQQMS